MGILPAAKSGIAVWCLVAASTLRAVAAEPASCNIPSGSFVLSNGTLVSRPGTNPDPTFKTHTLIPYPELSQRHHERGTAVVLVSVAADGTPTDVIIRRSSGSQRLDDAAIDHIKTHWRWPPSQGCQQAVTVIWNQMSSGPFPPAADFQVKMPESAYPPGARERMEGGSSTLLEIETDGQGAVTGGRVIDSSGFRDLDDQALAIVKNSPALMKGQVAGKHILSAYWDSPPGMIPPNSETVLVTGRAMPYE